MSNFQFPELLLAGVYDSDTEHKNCIITKKRSVNVFEIELPINAEGISFINDNSCKFNDNFIICAKPGQTRHCKLPHKCSYIYLKIESGIVYDTLMSIPDFLKISNEIKYKDLFSEIISAVSFPFEGSEIYTAGKVMELIYAMYQDINIHEKSKGPKSKVIDDAIKYMDKHFTENLHLNDIASKMNLSPIYFHKIFLQSIGRTPYKYMLDLKLNKAKQLLISTTFTLQEITFKTGFSSQSYFGYIFKKEFGKTPMQYRKDMYSQYPKL